MKIKPWFTCPNCGQHEIYLVRMGEYDTPLCGIYVCSDCMNAFDYCDVHKETYMGKINEVEDDKITATNKLKQRLHSVI